MKKKHKHKKHKSQESERSKEGGEAVSQGSNSLEQDKPTPSSAGTCYYSIDFLSCSCFCVVIVMFFVSCIQCFVEECKCPRLN